MWVLKGLNEESQPLRVPTLSVTASSWAMMKRLPFRHLTVCKGVMSALIDQHRGRVIDPPDDNMLSDFPVSWMRCCVLLRFKKS